MQLIRVVDDGHGIHKDDMVLALESHATSKLKQQDDLYHITSLGFRGEAISSIASIANFKLTSCAQGAEQAKTFTGEPATGEKEISPAAPPVGATVEVRNLFFTTPARKKFLRSERTEFLHILEIVRCLALSHFEVSFELHHKGKKVFSCRGSDSNADNHIAAIIGKAFEKYAILLDYDVDDMHLQGYLGRGELCRSQSDRQYFYLNSRLIRDKNINHAIRMAFSDDIPLGRYPSYVLFLAMSPFLTDVNVNPTKHEVRFSNARNVHDFIHASLCSSLLEEQQLFHGVADSGSDKVVDQCSRIESVFNSRPCAKQGQLPRAYSGTKDIQNPCLESECLNRFGTAVANIKERFIISIVRDGHVSD